MSKQGEVFSPYFMSIQLEITNPGPTVRSFCPSSDLLMLFSEVLLLPFVSYNFKMSLKTSVDSYHVAPAKRIYITAPDANFYVIFKNFAHTLSRTPFSFMYPSFVLFRDKKKTER